MNQEALSVTIVYLSCHVFMTHNVGHFMSHIMLPLRKVSQVSAGLACKLASRSVYAKSLRNKTSSKVTWELRKGVLQ